MTLAIWWIRRDLRLGDNPALGEAVSRGGGVIPLFILDPALLSRSRWHAHADKRQAFLFGGLRALDAELQKHGNRLLIREGKPLDALQALVAETGATAIVAEEDHSPYARTRDSEIAKHLPLALINGLSLRPPDLVRKADGKPYTVFTPFSKAWKSFPLPTDRDLLSVPSFLLSPPSSFRSLPIPQLPVTNYFPPGEAEASRRLDRFTVGPSAPIHHYAEGRNQLDLDGTSALSPYFRFGMVSAREAVVATLNALKSARVAEARRGAETWLNELIWREFYISILYHFPQVLKTAFNPSLRNIEWRDDPAGLKAWQEGLTGFPVVDAAMRQLRETGWMHNRARMIVASFLTKDLLINWQEGEHWFMQNLIDGDPAANNGGWQWTAGVGTDAAPYFRIFNPILQSKKFDPQGLYIRKWVPELTNVPEKFIHEPSLMPGEAQRAAGCLIGKHYPAPIVDRSEARERTLAAYKNAQKR